MTVDLAKRAWDHGWRLDPIVRTLLDTDFYKLLMLQLIWKRYRDVPVTFELINRKPQVRLADQVDEQALREQLDHARTLRLTTRERVWLAGNSFHGRARMFEPEFLAWLADYRLPDYALERRDGQYRLTFSGSWADVTLWEIPALAIVGELRARAGLKRPVRTGHPLRPRQDPAVEQGRAAARPARPGPVRLRHAAAAQFPVAGLVRAGVEGGVGLGLHRLVKRVAGDGE